MSDMTATGENFQFTPETEAKAEKVLARYPDGWKASAVAKANGDTVTAYAYCLESSP